VTLEDITYNFKRPLYAEKEAYDLEDQMIGKDQTLGLLVIL